MAEDPDDTATEWLHYGRHCSVLGCMIGALAATSGWWPNMGILTRLGIYGALHAATIAVSWRGPQAYWRPPLFVSLAAVLSMLSASVGLALHDLHGLANLGAAPTLALASGLGGITYALLLRSFGARLGLTAVAMLSLGCMLATHAILAFGVYRSGGVWWFAAAWWAAFSSGLWFWDSRQTAAAARAGIL